MRIKERSLLLLLLLLKGKGFVENWPQLQVVSSLTAVT